MKRCLLCLQELDMFAGLEKNQKQQLCLCTEKRILKKHEYLYRQGEDTCYIYLIKSGKIKIVQLNQNGQERILDICGTGEILGELNFLDKQAASADAIAMEEAHICCLSQSEFATLIKDNPQFSIRIISYLAAQHHEDLQKYEQETRQTIKEKLLCLFYRFANKYGEPHELGTFINLKITQQELADMIGSSRVMIVNVLKDLEAMNAITREKHYYILKKDPCTSTHTFDYQNQ